MAILTPCFCAPVGAVSKQATSLLLVALLWSGATPSVYGQSSREFQIKAVLLFNLAQFVEWPTNTFETTNAPFVIGVLGPDPFRHVLDEVVRDERVQGRPIKVERYTWPSEIKTCHLLYVAETDARLMQRNLSQLPKGPIMTVSDQPGFLESGGALQLYTKSDGKIGMRINSETTRAAGLVVSAKLMRIAEVARRAD